VNIQQEVEYLLRKTDQSQLNPLDILNIMLKITLYGTISVKFQYLHLLDMQNINGFCKIYSKKKTATISLNIRNRLVCNEDVVCSP
jgi:hypothetical protein